MFLFLVPILPSGWQGWCGAIYGLRVIRVEGEGQTLLPGTGSLGNEKGAVGPRCRRKRMTGWHRVRAEVLQGL